MARIDYAIQRSTSSVAGGRQVHVLEVTVTQVTADVLAKPFVLSKAGDKLFFERVARYAELLQPDAALLDKGMVFSEKMRVVLENESESEFAIRKIAIDFKSLCENHDSMSDVLSSEAAFVTTDD